MATVYIGIILVMRVVQQICSKNQSVLFPKTFRGVTKLFALSKFFAAVPALLLLLIDGNTNVGAMTILTSSLSGFALVITSVCSLTAMKSGTMALTSMFSAAGLIVPCIAGIFLYNESMSWPQWIGIVVLIASSLLLISSAKQTNPQFSLKTVLYLLVSFLGNGLTMLLQMIFSHSADSSNVSLFSFFTFAIPCAVMTLITIFSGRGNGCENEKLPKRLIFFALLGGIAVFVVNQLATLASGFTPPAVLFGFINGGNTIIAALIAAIMFGEKLTAKSVSGILLGVTSLIVIKMF